MKHEHQKPFLSHLLLLPKKHHRLPRNDSYLCRLQLPRYHLHSFGFHLFLLSQSTVAGFSNRFRLFNLQSISTSLWISNRFVSLSKFNKWVRFAKNFPSDSKRCSDGLVGGGTTPSEADIIVFPLFIHTWSICRESSQSIRIRQKEKEQDDA